jgi:hypothetical protein
MFVIVNILIDEFDIYLLNFRGMIIYLKLRKTKQRRILSATPVTEPQSTIYDEHGHKCDQNLSKVTALKQSSVIYVNNETQGITVTKL